ncbi:hypothetical protein [Pseudomonas sp. TMP25]|uniref:hypothetical protein n=1 Tax=Pseudomonas sp. TMP25 TaxID=3136561 RepID=UPI00310195EC
MATLAEQRKAIGKGISASFDSGKSAAKQRRAIGKSIEAERRGQAVVDDLGRLAQPAQQRRTLRTVQPVGALPPARGRGVYVPPPVAPSTGGGIASPLTEKTRVEGGVTVPDRGYWPEAVVASSDGLLSFMIRPIKKSRFTDANNAEEVRDYAQPV